MFNCWIEILKKLPDSVLWLLGDNELAQKNLYKYINERNIKEDRLVFADKIPRDEHLERLKLADIVLDTRIYNGHTTTTDAFKLASQ